MLRTRRIGVVNKFKNKTDMNGLSQAEHGRRNGNHKRPRLPGDLACAGCGGALRHGNSARCVECNHPGVVEYGEFSSCDCRKLRCRECAGE